MCFLMFLIEARPGETLGETGRVRRRLQKSREVQDLRGFQSIAQLASRNWFSKKPALSYGMRRTFYDVVNLPAHFYAFHDELNVQLIGHFDYLI